MHATTLFRLTVLAAAMSLGTTHASDVQTSVTAKMSVAGLKDTGRYDRFIVTYRDGTTERTSASMATQAVSAAVSRANLRNGGATAMPLAVTWKRKLATGGDVLRTGRKLNRTEATALMQQIASDPSVLHVQPDLLMKPILDIKASLQAGKTLVKAADAGAAPNDPYLASYQWDFIDPVGGVRMPELWADYPQADGSGVTVAVIDTGITAHNDLDTSLADQGYDFISDAFVSGRATDDRVPGGWDLGDWTNADPYLSCTDNPEASSWHGTNVAGVIGEIANNALGMAGMSPNVHVIPVRALGHCGGYTSDIADAVVWASGGHVDGIPDNPNPARVINMSLGGAGACSDDPVTSAAISSAISRGTTVVVAAGNSTDDSANYTPASCPGVVTVAATGANAKRAYYSNYGTIVTLAAPGGSVFVNGLPGGTQDYPNGFVWAAYNAGTTTPVAPADGGSIYAGMAGTSQATPHVTATVALMQGAYAGANGGSVLTPAQVKNLLVSSVRPFYVTPDAPIGPGILDTHAAVALALGNTVPDYFQLTAGQTLTGQQVAAGGSLLYAITVPAGAKNLTIRVLGGTGDASLFVKAGQAPTGNGSDADFSSQRPGNAEVVIVAAPQATTYFIRMAAVKDVANASLLVTYVKP
jgi:serine protease